MTKGSQRCIKDNLIVVDNLAPRLFLVKEKNSVDSSDVLGDLLNSITESKYLAP